MTAIAMKKFFAGLILAVAACWTAPAADENAASAESQFQEAYQLLSKADDARDRRGWSEAVKLYGSALEKYSALSKRYPEYQPAVVKYRIHYCNSQMETILRRIEDSAVEQEGRSEGAGLQDAAAEIRQIRNAARLLMKDGDLARARAVLMDGLKQCPDDLSIRLMFASLQCQAGDFDAAAFLVESLKRDAPSNAAVHLMAGTVAFARGQNEEARLAIQRALELDPKLRAAHYDMARLLIESSPPDLKAARFHYQKALDMGAIPDRSLEQELDCLSGPPASAAPEEPAAGLPPPPDVSGEDP